MQFFTRAYLSLLLLLPSFSLSFAQTATANPLSLSFELGGNAVSYSVNLEKILYKEKNMSMRLGFHFFPVRIKGFAEYRSVGIVSEISSLTGKGKNKFEAGVGISYLYLYDNLQSYIFGDSADLLLLVPRIGYRIYSKDNRRYFKIAYTPLVVLDKNDGDDWDQGIIPFYLGISYGFQLKKRKND